MCMCLCVCACVCVFVGCRCMCACVFVLLCSVCAVINIDLRYSYNALYIVNNQQWNTSVSPSLFRVLTH